MWNLRFPNLDISKHRGYCDPPSKKNKEICVASSLDGEEKLSVLIHECLHAASWTQFSEEFVNELSEDIARALWRLGYRCQDEDQ